MSHFPTLRKFRNISMWVVISSALLALAAASML